MDPSELYDLEQGPSAPIDPNRVGESWFEMPSNFNVRNALWTMGNFEDDHNLRGVPKKIAYRWANTPKKWTPTHRRHSIQKRELKDRQARKRKMSEQAK